VIEGATVPLPVEEGDSGVGAGQVGGGLDLSGRIAGPGATTLVFAFSAACFSV